MSVINNQVNRNPRYIIQESGSQFVTGSVDDNFYVSKPIPANDFGYAWISGSAENATTSSPNLGGGAYAVSGYKDTVTGGTS